MGTDKRARQKANRAARIEAAYDTQRKQEGQRRTFTVLIIVAVLAAAIGAYVLLSGDDDVASTDDTTGASGVECVERVDPLPEGAPEFDMPVGPAPTELVIEDLLVGDGEEVPEGATVAAHYVGVACSTGVIFDSSWQRGSEPTSFSLSSVISGWQQGIPGMKVGGRRLLVIPGDLAYGAQSPSDKIGPNETLVFVVDIFGIEGGEEEPLPEGSPARVPAPGAGASIAGETPCPPTDGTAARTTSFEQAPPRCIDPAKQYTAVFETNQGTIRIALDTERTPNTTNNFVVLARYGYYDGTAIFRTDTSIDILQGGSPTTNSASDPGPGYRLEDEGGEFDFSDAAGQNGRGPFTYRAGQLVMARSAGPDSSGAQFFLTAGPKAANLDDIGTYIVFGDVTEGLEVIEKILGLHAPDPASGLGGGPSEPVVITKVIIEES